MKQAVQVTETGDRLDGVHLSSDPQMSRLHLPHGYGYAATQETNPSPPERLCWSDVIDTDWGSREGQSLEWTAAELRARARRAEAHWHEVLNQHRGGRDAAAMSASERVVAYTSASHAHKKWVKDTTGGVQGMPDFSKLSYFRCATNG
jgi:hypothetical protein